MPDEATLERLFVVMVRCRSFEEAFIRQALQDGTRIGHPYAGQEAVAAGVACALAPSDRMLSTHRSHGHAVATGCDLTRLALELFGKAGGLCRGRAGEMGVAQLDIGFIGATDIVAGNLPTGVGVALAAKLDRSQRCVVAFVGDGGVNQGSFHESLNLAAIWSLPYVVVVENNQYAETTPVEYATAGPGIAATREWLWDPWRYRRRTERRGSARCSQEALERGRAGAGPTLIEARTYRYYGHYYGDRHERYRTPVEVAYWRARDPLALHREALLQAGAFSEERLTHSRPRCGPRPRPPSPPPRSAPIPTWDDLTDEVFAPGGSHMNDAPSLRYWQAVNDALRLEMRDDERIVVLGEDVAGAAGREQDGLVDAWGGPYGITRGLIQEFGAERVRDTPISEAAFIGAAIGLAIEGYRPWVDLMFTHFAGVAWDQITNKLARAHYQTGGQATVPMTMKTFGSCYAPFLHFPGLICVAASDAYTAKGLTIAALREDNPVVCFDNVRLIRQTMPVPEDSYTVPLGKARLLREGDDVTLLGISASTAVCLEAGELLAERGIEAEIVDLLTLSPWDVDTVTTSLAKTGRLVVVDFDHPTCSLASEIVATLSERAEAPFLSPPLRLLPPNVPLAVEDGNPKLTDMYFPSATLVADSVEAMLAGHAVTGQRDAAS